MIFATWFDSIPRSIDLPNGKKLECFITGDQYARRLHDANNYTLYALFASSAGTLGGVYRSVDNGTTWDQIAPGATGNFTPLTGGSGSSQGNYDLVVTSTPNGEECIIGGIDLWSWVHTPSSADPENGQWYAVSAWYVDPSVPIYIHADKAC